MDICSCARSLEAFREGFKGCTHLLQVGWQKAEFLPNLGSFNRVQGAAFNLLYFTLCLFQQGKASTCQRAEQVAGILRNRAPKEHPRLARLLSVLI